MVNSINFNPRMVSYGEDGALIAEMFVTNGDLSYRDNGDSLTITGYSGQSASVVIPAMIDGKPVTAVGDARVTSTPQPLTLGQRTYQH